jgi:tetratricopeptide (TPR) repeat protein
MRQGRTAEAEASFSRAASIDADLLAPIVNLALLGVGPELDDAAVERLRRAAARPGASPEEAAAALAALAGRESRRGRHEAARAYYAEALRHRPEDAGLLNNIAVEEDHLGLDREAMLHLDAALDADPSLLVARNNQGILHLHRGDPARAEATFREVIGTEERFWRAHYNLGVVLAAQGRLEEAASALDRAAALAPRDGAVRYNRALVARSRGGTVEEERRGYEEALALAPDLAEAHLSLGALLADPATPSALRDEARALEHLQAFLRLGRSSDADGRAQADSWLSWLDGR